MPRRPQGATRRGGRRRPAKRAEPQPFVDPLRGPLRFVNFGMMGLFFWIFFKSLDEPDTRILTIPGAILAFVAFVRVMIWTIQVQTPAVPPPRARTARPGGAGLDAAAKVTAQGIALAGLAAYEATHRPPPEPPRCDWCGSREHLTEQHVNCDVCGSREHYTWEHDQYG